MGPHTLDTLHEKDYILAPGGSTTEENPPKLTKKEQLLKNDLATPQLPKLLKVGTLMPEEDLVRKYETMTKPTRRSRT